MKEIFNKYAPFVKPFSKDLMTSIPRCYRMIFDHDVSRWSDSIGRAPDRTDRVLGHMKAGALTAAFAATGAGLCGAFLAVAAVGVGGGALLGLPALAVGLAAGAVTSPLLGMKFYAAINNGMEHLFEKIGLTSSAPRMADKAFPHLEEAIQHLKP